MTHDPTDTQPDVRAEKLAAFVQSRMRVQFAWGSQDCCIFAADWVRELTGVDPAADVRGSYATAEDALRTLESLGGIDAVGSRGGNPIPPLMARAGDVGVIVTEGRELLAVCVGEVWLAPAVSGLAPVPLQAARAAWRV